MSRSEPASDSTPFFSDESEVEGPEDGTGASALLRRQEDGSGEGRAEEEKLPASGVSDRRALLTVLILCYVNLLNYMDRFTVAGRGVAAQQSRAPPTPPSGY